MRIGETCSLGELGLSMVNFGKFRSSGEPMPGIEFQFNFQLREETIKKVNKIKLDKRKCIFLLQVTIMKSDHRFSTPDVEQYEIEKTPNNACSFYAIGSYLTLQRASRLVGFPDESDSYVLINETRSITDDCRSFAWYCLTVPKRQQRNEKKKRRKEGHHDSLLSR